jgi:hypothetical protein
MNAFSDFNIISGSFEMTRQKLISVRGRQTGLMLRPNRSHRQRLGRSIEEEEGVCNVTEE